MNFFKKLFSKKTRRCRRITVEKKFNLHKGVEGLAINEKGLKESMLRDEEFEYSPKGEYISKANLIEINKLILDKEIQLNKIVKEFEKTIKCGAIVKIENEFFKNVIGTVIAITKHREPFETRILNNWDNYGCSPSSEDVKRLDVYHSMHMRALVSRLDAPYARFFHYTNEVLYKVRLQVGGGSEVDVDVRTAALILIDAKGNETRLRDVLKPILPDKKVIEDLLYLFT